MIHDGKVREQTRVHTPLGIRFWDPVGDRQVREGLHVMARPKDAPGPHRRAFRTSSDIYAFDNLASPAQAAASPPQSRTWLIEVEDARRHFLPVAFEVDLPLPYSGVFLSSPQQSPPGGTPPGFHLYPTPSRRATPGQAAIRGEVQDAATGAGAAHALVRVVMAGQWVRHGVTDAEGRFAVLFPYPPFDDALAGSPGSNGDGVPLTQRTWDFDIEVFYDPAAQAAVPGSPIPEYRSLLNQPPAHLWAGDPNLPPQLPIVPRLPGVLTFGEELVVRSAGRSQLLVSTAAAFTP